MRFLRRTLPNPSFSWISSLLLSSTTCRQESDSSDADGMKVEHQTRRSCSHFGRRSQNTLAGRALMFRTASADSSRSVGAATTSCQNQKRLSMLTTQIHESSPTCTERSDPWSILRSSVSQLPAVFLVHSFVMSIRYQPGAVGSIAAVLCC